MAKERRDGDDWLGEWNEVQDHRYDPGHWLGRIHPFYRRFAATGTSVGFGLGLIAFGVLSAVAALWRPPLDDRVAFGVLAVMFVLLGISNVRAARRAPKRARGTIADHDPRRHPGHDSRE